MVIVSDTARELIAACLAEPDEDGPRLAYADLVEEEGDVEHAELIRVQCELAQMGTMPTNEPQVGDQLLCEVCFTAGVHRDKHGSRKCVNCSSDKVCKLRPFHIANPTYEPLKARESALLHARLMPCPECAKEGEFAGMRLHDSPCELCSGSGLCPGDIVRGFSVCKVPLSVCGREVWERCENNAHKRGIDSDWCPSQHCTSCGGVGRFRVWQPATWLAAARERGATVEVSDREPADNLHGNNNEGPTSDMHYWWFSSTTGLMIPHHLPPSLCRAMDGIDDDYRAKWYPSRAAAVAALGRAVMGG